MKVILKRDVKKLGNAGDIVEVAEGYARNYLIPRGLVEPATEGALKRIAEEQRRQKKMEATEKAEAEEIAEELRGLPVVLKAKCGENGKLFGSVTAADVAEALAKQHRIKVDKRKIQMDSPIKEVGTHKLPVRLYSGVDAEITVEVTGED